MSASEVPFATKGTERRRRRIIDVPRRGAAQAQAQNDDSEKPRAGGTARGDDGDDEREEEDEDILLRPSTKGHLSKLPPAPLPFSGSAARAEAVGADDELHAAKASAHDADRVTTAGSGSDKETLPTSVGSGADSTRDLDEDGPLSETMQSGDSQDEFSFGTTKPAALPPPSCVPGATTDGVQGRQVSSAPDDVLTRSVPSALPPIPRGSSRSPRRNQRPASPRRADGADSDSEDGGPEFTFGTTTPLQLPDSKLLPPAESVKPAPAVDRPDGPLRSAARVLATRPPPRMAPVIGAAPARPTTPPPQALAPDPNSPGESLAIQAFCLEQQALQQQQQQHQQQMLHLQQQQQMHQQHMMQQEFMHQQHMHQLHNSHLQSVLENVACAQQVAAWHPHVQVSPQAMGPGQFPALLRDSSWHTGVSQEAPLMAAMSPQYGAELPQATEPTDSPHGAQLAPGVEDGTTMDLHDLENSGGDVDHDGPEPFGPYFPSPPSPTKGIVLAISCSAERLRRLVAGICLSFVILVLVAVAAYLFKGRW